MKQNRVIFFASLAVYSICICVIMVADTYASNDKLKMIKATAKFVSSYEGTANSGAYFVAADPQLAIDGNSSTSYSSSIPARKDSAQWWQADLGNITHVKKIRVLWHKLDNYKNIGIVGSVSGDFPSDEVSLISKRKIQATGTFEELKVDAKIRFLRINYYGGESSGHGLDLSEFEAFGVPVMNSKVIAGKATASNNQSVTNNVNQYQYLDVASVVFSANTTAKTIANYTQATIHDCASSLDVTCIQEKLDAGSDINEMDSNRVTPIFYAIEAVRDDKKETKEGFETIRYLIENGADLTIKARIYPFLYTYEMTPKENLEISIQGSQHFYSAPNASNINNLFLTKSVLDLNSAAITANLRAMELGITYKEFLSRKNKINELRNRKTFEGFSEAFLVSREKSDFEDAEKLATTAKQKNELEYLAVIAVPNKERIFDVKILMDSFSTEKITDKGNIRPATYKFFGDIKASDFPINGLTKVSKAQQPAIDIKNPYKVTIQYNLVIKKENVHSSFGRESREICYDRREITNTYLLTPNGFKDEKDLNFGTARLADSRRVLGGLGRGEETIIEPPKITKKIVKVERM